MQRESTRLLLGSHTHSNERNKNPRETKMLYGRVFIYRDEGIIVI
jgi:hypothetical protein